MDFIASNKEIIVRNAETKIDLPTGALSGSVSVSTKRLGDLKGVFADEAARASMPQDTVAYTVHSHVAEREGTPGGLFFGTSLSTPAWWERSFS